MSNVQGWQVKLDEETAAMMRQKYIAFDTETTGLDLRTDRIIELGAVIFEQGKPTCSFSSLINAGMYVRPSSQTVNHISNEELKKAPHESEVYPAFLEFLGEAADGEILLCAHNAKVDFSFLARALERCNMKATFYYIDTLSLSRELLDMPDYKQQTIAENLGFINEEAHRACSDAKVCGQIMWHLLECYSNRDC